MKKKALSLALALVLCLGLLPTAAFATETKLPDWYFLFAVFKNVDANGNDKDGKAVHTKYSMSQDEVDVARSNAKDFEAHMNSIGVMRAHIEVVEIDETVTELEEYSDGSYVSPEQAAPLLKNQVDLDLYDHVFCIVSLDNLITRWMGVTGAPFENGTGASCVNFVNREYALKNYTATDKGWPPSLYVHEFLHFGEQLNRKFSAGFSLHGIQAIYNTSLIDAWKGCYTDIILNQAKGNSETGTGVHPAVWQYPPHMLRAITELTIPSGVTSIGHDAFLNYTNLTSVTIPSSVTYLDVSAFHGCSNLTSVIIPASVTSIGDWAFNYSGVTDVYYGGTEAQWKSVSIGNHNAPLTKATIHYNSTGPTTPSYQVSDWARDRVALAVSTGLAAGSLGSDYRVNITRAQFAATAVKLYEAMSGKTIAPVTDNPFTDTKDPVILQAASMGFVSGVGNGKFSPDALVTREQAAVMLSSVYTKLGGTLPAVEATTFADNDRVAAWSRNAVAFMSEKGIVSGVGGNRFSPQGQASIEQALLIALKMFEDLK